MKRNLSRTIRYVLDKQQDLEAANDMFESALKEAKAELQRQGGSAIVNVRGFKYYAWLNEAGNIQLTLYED